jgi:hypothetical protein
LVCRFLELSAILEPGKPLEYLNKTKINPNKGIYFLIAEFTTYHNR